MTKPATGGSGSTPRPREIRSAARPGAQGRSAWGERLREAWNVHPLVSLLRLRRRIIFCRNLLALVKAGVPISSSLANLARAPGGQRNSELQRADARLRAGATLAEALDQVTLLDPVTHALLAGGEQSGRIEQVLSRRAQQLEETRRLAGQVLMMLVYPLYLLGALIFVGPLLSLPAALQAGATRGDLGAIYLANMLALAGLAAGSVLSLLALPLLVRMLRVERQMDRVLLRSPVFGALYRETYAARLAGGLSEALGAGVEVGRAVQLAVRGMSSPSLCPRATAVADSLASGHSLTDALAEIGVLDADALGQVAVAERAGGLDTALGRVAQDLWESVARRARLAAYVLVALLVAVLLTAVVLKLLGVIFGPISRAYRLPENLDRL